MHITFYAPLSITKSTIAGTVCPNVSQGWLTSHLQDLPKDDTPTYCQNAIRHYTDNQPLST